jgi:hypothetical protein
MFHIVTPDADDLAWLRRGQQPEVLERHLGLLTAIAPEDIPADLAGLIVQDPPVLWLGFSFQGFVTYDTHAVSSRFDLSSVT